MAESPRIQELKRRVQVDPASIAFAALAEEYRRAGRQEEAIATCQAGLQRHPAYLSAHVTLGRALLELGRFDEARQELEHVLRAAPENLAAIRGLAEIHHRRGELPEALEQYRSALSVARHDAELEAKVDQISRQVAPADAPFVPLPTISFDSGAAAMSERRAAATARQPATTAAPADVKPAPKAPPLALITWTRPPQPEPEPNGDAQAEAEAEAEPELEADPERALRLQPAAPAGPDPTLSALEDLLATIVREKAHLGDASDLRR